MSFQKPSPRFFISNFEISSNPRLFCYTYLPTSFLSFFCSLKHGAVFKSAICAFLGLLLWTLIEYLVHRFVFHRKVKNEVAQKLLYDLHIEHHEHPKSFPTAIHPLIGSAVAVFLIFVAHYFFSKNGFSIFTGLTSGILLGSVWYECFHYAVHAYKPPFKFLIPLWRLHLSHHFQDEHKNFGITTPLWDYVFGTLDKRYLKK